MSKFISGLTLAIGLVGAGYVFKTSSQNEVSSAEAMTSAEAILGVKPDRRSPANSGGAGGVASAGAGAVDVRQPSGQRDPKEFMTLAKGVQAFCLDQYDLAPCMAYAVKCGRECTTLLPQSMRERMFADYNKYLMARGEKPLAPLRKVASSAGKPAPFKSK